jgi:hypothetical protein
MWWWSLSNREGNFYLLLASSLPRFIFLLFNGLNGATYQKTIPHDNSYKNIQPYVSNKAKQSVECPCTAFGPWNHVRQNTAYEYAREYAHVKREKVEDTRGKGVWRNRGIVAPTLTSASAALSQSK